MPLLRSRAQVHKSRFKFVQRFFLSMAFITFVFVVAVGIHYLLGWW